MEWKLQRFAPRRIRTEEQVLWVSTIFYFLGPTLSRGFLRKAQFVMPD